MKRFFFLIFLLLFAIGYSSFAQITFELKAENQSLKNDLVKTTMVKSPFLKSKNSIGKIFVDTKTMADVNLDKSINQAVLKQINSYEKNINAPTLILEIEIFELTEKIFSKNIVAGKIWLEIKAKMVSDGDTNNLCRAISSLSYQRSFTIKGTEKIAKEVELCVDNCYAYILNYIKKNKGVLENYAERSKVIIKPFKVISTLDTVYYQQRKVTWADFKGPVRANNSYGAAIFTSFGIETKLYTENSQISMEITPKIYMDKNMSWVRPGNKTAYALAHEQLHFDIAYVLTLEFLNKIRTFQAKTEKDLLSLVNFEYLEFYKKLNKIQEQYDKETDHSLEKEQQYEWQKKIQKNIAEFYLNNLYK
jgi:hypothetical protein